MKEKTTTKTIALAICAVFLIAMSVISPASTDTNTKENQADIVEEKERNHTSSVVECVLDDLPAKFKQDAAIIVSAQNEDFDLHSAGTELAKEYPFMYPDTDTLARWMESYNAAPRISISTDRVELAAAHGSHSVLSHLDYDPAERNQGLCGNCWVWVGTGCMEVALDVETGVYDRLSVQYLNSLYRDGGSTDKPCACCGGSPSSFADFYTVNTTYAIPWSNTNANWQDCNTACLSGSCCTVVPALTISTTPHYPIIHTEDKTIVTHDVGQNAAISNIKSILDSNNAVWFAFYLPNETDSVNFINFWYYEPESALWDPSYSCGHRWIEGKGVSHAVLCVGYNNSDPDNPYWIMLNSWGNTSLRPNGLFRMRMNIDYDCYVYHPNYYLTYKNLHWQMLDIDFGVSLEEAVDSAALAFTTGGNANWSGQTGIFYYGGDAAESGDIGHNQNTWMQTTVYGPGNLSFYWKVSSESLYDYLRFYVDGIEQTRISGTTSWAQKTYSINSSTHTVHWRYTKDLSVSDGEDCGWVDKVEFLPREVGYFDTGASATPYPSISGTHNGTIIPSCTISVNHVYIYPCPGTGGHTKYVKIWNSTGWNVTATWNGYTGDWHNLTFNNSFTLYANETYNYTIHTGSYPQIIHEPSWNATGGVITCTEFVEINGKRHEGWIPAIWLE